MLSRAFTKPSKSIKDDDYNSSKWGSILEYSQDGLVGFIDDLPLVFCGDNESQLSLREVLRASVGVMGESRLGITEKVVLLAGKVYAVKRFRKVCVRRNEFGRRLQRLAYVSKKCEYLVPVTAYLYAKRIKFVLSDYYPMGSLADLLAGGRKCGHTALDWDQRLTIAICVARAIAFIHTQCPPHEKSMKMNVHGNIKPSNVMINTNFTACLSDYGFTQLVDSEEVSEAWQSKPPPESPYCNRLCQKSDMYNFGIMLLDMLGGTRAPSKVKCIIESKEEIQRGELEFFEFSVEGKERLQALKVLEIALACTNKPPESRPSIEKIMRLFRDF